MSSKKPTYQELLKEIELLRLEVKEVKAASISQNTTNIELLVAKDKAEADKMYFEALVGNGNDVVTIINAEGNSIYQSPAREKVLGYSQDEIVENIFHYMHVDDRDRMYKQFQDFIPKLGSVEKMHYRYIHKNQTWRYIEGTGENMLNHPIVKGIVLNFRDVTDRRVAELALEKSESELQKAIKSKDKFFSIIAHDLRTPFSAMLGFSNLLNENFDSFGIEKQKKMLGLMNESIQNTYKLLDNLLLWSYSQSGNISFKPHNINLYLLSTEIEKIVRQSAQNKTIKIVNEIPEDIYINADKDMISTIMRNLITNAIKFTPKNGTVQISAKLEYINKNNTHTQITIKDNGVGISKEIQANMFDISKNTSTTGTANETGTGLGLILCKEFVEKHNGQIWVDSVDGKGSSFHFLIPN